MYRFLCNWLKILAAFPKSFGEWRKCWFLEACHVRLQLLLCIAFVLPLHRIGRGESQTPCKQKQRTKTSKRSSSGPVCFFSTLFSSSCFFYAIFSAVKIVLDIFLYIASALSSLQSVEWHSPSLFPRNVNSLPGQFTAFLQMVLDIFTFPCVCSSELILSGLLHLNISWCLYLQVTNLLPCKSTKMFFLCGDRFSVINIWRNFPQRIFLIFSLCVEQHCSDSLCTFQLSKHLCQCLLQFSVNITIWIYRVVKHMTNLPSPATFLLCFGIQIDFFICV